MKTIEDLTDAIDKITREVHEREEKKKDDIIKQVSKEYKGDWDVTIHDTIDYFDANLSYELTGYKPIDETHGLDFNPDWFTEAKQAFMRTGHYCQFPSNTKSYKDFWDSQYKRCRDGLTINGYTITGDNYYFLNFYQLLDLTNTSKAGAGRNYAFPSFYVKQYEYFHYVELCKRLRVNAIGLKARGVGFSEIGAAIVVNTYNCRQNTQSMIAASLELYVAKTLSKCWKQLDFLNDFTDMGFFKLRQVIDTTTEKKASVYKVINGQRTEAGWMSDILGITANIPSKIRGDRTDLLIYEESGSWPNWKKAFLQGDALVGIQGNQFGIKMAWGTGGDSGPALEGLANAYSNPEVYGALPYKHKYTPSGEEIISAYFIPAYTIINKPGYMDHRGFTDPVKGKAYYEKQRDLKAADPAALLIYTAEYCFNAEEALALEGTNKFNKILLSEQIARVRMHKKELHIENGVLNYKYNGVQDKKHIAGFIWTPIPNGTIHILEHPVWTLKDLRDAEGHPVAYEKMNNLYVAGIDSIDLGQDDTSANTKDPSKFAITIKKRIVGINDPQYVAYYKERPNDIRDAYKTAIKLLQYYNCKANIEASKVSMITWARENQYLGLFIKRPRATLTDVMRGVSKQYGTPATATIIEHQTDLIKYYIEDYCHDIWFDEILSELTRYTDENKRKFDLVASMGMAELADEELSGQVPSKTEVQVEEWQDIGWYFDSNGIRRYGVIPKKNQQQINYNLNFGNDRSGIRTSNPEYY